MKTKCLILFAVTLLFAACGTLKEPKTIIPKAINTVNSVSLEELNLKHGEDYKILNTISAEAVVSYVRKNNSTIIQEENGEFSLTFKTDKNGVTNVTSTGIVRFGFLYKDYGSTMLQDNPEYVARNLAIYRLINAVKILNADGVIEPLISSNAEQRGNTIIIKTIASAKLIKLNTDK